VSAKHALLGLLIHRPAYRYQLGERLGERLGPAYDINSGQLYQTLKKLRADGLIERIDGALEDQDERHVLAITASGVAFDRWFDETPRGVRLLRRPLLVKIALAGPERLKDALEQIGAYERDCAARLKDLSHMHDEIPEAPEVGSRVRADHVFLRLGLSADIAHLKSELRWAKHAHEMVSWLPTEDAIWPSEHGRSGASKETRDRQSARDELFGRIAAKQRNLGSAKQGRDRDG
jgi:DNA-binding PadR family transcriptional regulator